jgi:hypothetical protein
MGLRQRQRRLAVASAALALALAGCGDDGSSDGGSSKGSKPSRKDAKVVAAYDHYLAALNKGDGATVCQLLVPAGTEKLRPPAKRESCAEAITDSIGQPGPGGLRWRSAKVKGTPAVERDGREATLRVDVTNTYAGGATGPERESVKLAQSGGEWLLAEPDAALYHAIGQS